MKKAPKREEKNKKSKEIIELENLLKRVQADFENYRKRTQKEKEEFAKYANTDLILKILPLLDNLNLAIKHIPAEISQNEWVSGIRHIKTQLEQIIASEGVQPIHSLGEPYDPHLHEVIEEVPSSKKRGIIVEEVLKGYKLNEKIIRHPKVKVSSGREAKKERR